MRAVQSAGKSAVRAFGTATSWMRPLPDFLVIGTKRGGTTSLYRYLSEHPQMLPMFPSARHLPMAEDLKGAHFFDTNYGKGTGWYRSFFASSPRRRLRARAEGGALAGEASPYYLFHPLAAERAAAAVPHARLVVMLRHPVERTYSHWKEQVRNGVERLTFEEALAAEDARLDGEAERIVREPGYTSFPHEQQSYARQSEYADSLARWLRVYPRQQLLVVRSEDFYRDAQAVYGSVCRFLGLPPHPLARPRVWNAAPATDMGPELRRHLNDRFRPSVEALEELLGERMHWDLAAVPTA